VLAINAISLGSVHRRIRISVVTSKVKNRDDKDGRDVRFCWPSKCSRLNAHDVCCARPGALISLNDPTPFLSRPRSSCGWCQASGRSGWRRAPAHQCVIPLEWKLCCHSRTNKNV
jgi:hypothetical protein